MPPFEVADRRTGDADLFVIDSQKSPSTSEPCAHVLCSYNMQSPTPAQPGRLQASSSPPLPHPALLPLHAPPLIAAQHRPRIAACIVLTMRMSCEAASLQSPAAQISSETHRHCRLPSPSAPPCTCSTSALPLLLALILLISLLRASLFPS